MEGPGSSPPQTAVASARRYTCHLQEAAVYKQIAIDGTMVTAVKKLHRQLKRWTLWATAGGNVTREGHLSLSAPTAPNGSAPT